MLTLLISSIVLIALCLLWIHKLKKALQLANAGAREKEELIRNQLIAIVVNNDQIIFRATLEQMRALMVQNGLNPDVIKLHVGPPLVVKETAQ